jgi:hypothetical protein
MQLNIRDSKKRAMSVLFFAAVIIFNLFLHSCKKASICKTCTTTYTATTSQPLAGYPQTTSDPSFTECGDALKDIDGKTITQTTQSAGVVITVVAKTTCK